MREWLKKYWELIFQIGCVAVITISIGGALLSASLPTPESVSVSRNRAAMVAAAQHYDRIMEQTGDKIAAGIAAQEVYITLGGTGESWQVTAGEGQE